MAAGWPTKVTYANGDVFSAGDINDTNGTLNYIDPTSATDKQVLTRDNASGGKVKWADSPANTLTTTGDLYYASAANTPARLPIGSTDQVLKVSGGVPTWGAAASGLTLISTQTATSGTVITFSSIPSTYTHLEIVGGIQSAIGAPTVYLDWSGTIVTNVYNYPTSATAINGGTSTSLFTLGVGRVDYPFLMNISIPYYKNTSVYKSYMALLGNQSSNRYWGLAGGSTSTTSAISTITLTSSQTIQYATVSLYGRS